MRRLNRFTAPLAALPLLLAATACTEEEAAKPPPSDAKLCGVTMASWWFDATGGDDLSGRFRGKLPLPRATQDRVTSGWTRCFVYSGKEHVGNLEAEVPSAGNIANIAKHLAERPADRRFTAAGGKGAVDPHAEDDGADATWTCKSAALYIELHHLKNTGKRVELTMVLAKRIAAVVGCPEPAPARTPG
nr:hypothetical protein OG781_01735 [Streptomyces sp. NBC_00830]